MVILTLSEKGGETRQLTFEKDEVTIGRVQGNDIVLAKGNVSKRHCRIFSENGRFSVEDTKSTNGTYINGRKIPEATFITGNDKIYVGDYVIRVDNAGFEGAMTAPPVPEAGSLSTALPRRPPPPPSRATPVPPHAAEDDSSLRATVPPPPPPPGSRRDTGRLQPAVADREPSGPSLAVDDDGEEEGLSSRPRLPVPPLRSPLASLADDEPDEGEDGIPTAGRDRPTVGMGVAGRSPTPPPTSEAATWLKRLLEPADVTAVYVTGTLVEIDRAGTRERVDEPPPSLALREALRGLAARGAPRPSAETRIVNVALPEPGLRLAALFPPLAHEVTATITKATAAGRTLEDLAVADFISNDARDLLNTCLSTRRNILVGGDRRSLDVVLAALGNGIPSTYRIISLVDALEPPQGARFTRLAAGPQDGDVVFAAAALRPDYLIAEVASPLQAADLLTHAVLGGDGNIVAIAARSATDALQRLSALGGAALGGLAHVRELVATAFDAVLFAGTLADGNLRMLEIAEPRLLESGALGVDPIISWKGSGAGGRFQAASTASRLATTLAARGVRLPSALAQK